MDKHLIDLLRNYEELKAWELSLANDNVFRFLLDSGGCQRVLNLVAKERQRIVSAINEYGRENL